MLTIRPMKLEDLDSVFAIEFGAHRAPWGIDVFYNCILAKFDCRVLECLEKNESQQKIVGYFVCNYKEEECHLLNLCVAEAMQGRGFGQFLIENLIDSLKKNAKTSVFLEVRPSNAVALSLYKKLGFEFVEIKEAYYEDENQKEDAWVLKKIIREKP